MKNEKIEQLLSKDDFILCEAWKSELGYNTKRFEIESIKDAIDWISESDNNTVKVLNGNLWGKDEDMKITII